MSLFLPRSHASSGCSDDSTAILFDTAKSEHGHRGRDGGELRVGGRRRGQDHQGAGELHRRGRPAQPIHLGTPPRSPPFRPRCPLAAAAAPGPHIAAREAAVVVACGQAHSALVVLAGDVGLCQFPLRIEAVELLLPPGWPCVAFVDPAPPRRGQGPEEPQTAVFRSIEKPAAFSSRANGKRHPPVSSNGM